MLLFSWKKALDESNEEYVDSKPKKIIEKIVDNNTQVVTQDDKLITKIFIYTVLINNENNEK